MADANTEEPHAKRLKVEDGAAMAALHEPRAQVQTPVKESQATPLDDHIETPNQQDVSHVAHPSPTVHATPEQPEVIRMDPRGDVEIRVQDRTGNTKTVFAVCSRALARVSPDWACLFYSSDSENCQQSHLTISMNRNETSCLEIMLHVLHHNTSKIPVRLTLKELLLIFHLGRRFQITAQLSIWGIYWFRNPSLFSDFGSRTPLVLTYRMLLANELGLSDVFHESMRDVACKMGLDGNGNLGYHSGGRFQKLRTIYLKDEECAELLDNLRSSAISKQLKSLKAITDNLVLPQTTQAVPRSGCQTCNYKWIGCIIQHLSAPQTCVSEPEVRTLPLWPIPKLEHYIWAVEDLRNHIQIVQDNLDSMEQCRGITIEQPNDAPVNNGRGGRFGGQRGGGQRGGGHRGSGRVATLPCVPPTLLLPSPIESFEVEIKKLKTRYNRV